MHSLSERAARAYRGVPECDAGRAPRRHAPPGRELTPPADADKNWRTPDPAGTEEGAIAAYCYIDLHAHSTDASDDAGGTVEGYLKWIVARRKKGYQVDGFVLTEHRHFDPTVDYSALAARYGVTVLRGAEVETDVGHVLVYGITEQFTRDLDLTDVALPYEDVFTAARDCGGFAVGAHAGRPRIGLAEHVAERGVSLDAVTAIEQLNGGSSDQENALAAQLAEEHGLHCVGGSDAHYVSAIGRCMTAFPRPVETMEALVEALSEGGYHAVRAEETLPSHA